jgi:hypothetical protein
MNRRYSALALSALTLGAVALTATEASAMLKDPEPGAAAAEAYEWPDEGSGYPASEATSLECNYPNHTVCDVASVAVPAKAATVPSPSDDNGAEALQAGASALGGAGLAFGGMWLYRRRHLLAG